MSLRPACAGTQTGTPQRLKMPPIPQPWGEQHTPRIESPGGGGGATLTQSRGDAERNNLQRVSQHQPPFRGLPAT